MISSPSPSVVLLQVTLTLPASLKATTDKLASVGGGVSVMENGEEQIVSATIFTFYMQLVELILQCFMDRY